MMKDNASCGSCIYFTDCNKLLHVEKETQRECSLFSGKKAKYNNQKAVIDGHTFPSQKEANRYMELKMLQRAGVVTSIELQPEFMLKDGFVKGGKKFLPIKYRADFRVTYRDGHIEIEDTKGYGTKEFAIKRKLFEDRYQDLTLKVL